MGHKAQVPFTASHLIPSHPDPLQSGTAPHRAGPAALGSSAPHPNRIPETLGPEFQGRPWSPCEPRADLLNLQENRKVFVDLEARSGWTAQVMQR